MALCDYQVENYIRNKNFEYLNGLEPERRFAEKFRMVMDALSLDIKENDELVGWFRFDGSGYEFKQFDDEKLDAAAQKTADDPLQFGSRTYVDKGHTLINYESIIKGGLISFERRIEKELSGSPDDKYLISMREALAAVKDFCEKTARTVDAKAASGIGVPKNIDKMREAVRRVPYLPARNFREALQSLWIIHFLVPLAENAWYSISLGRLDRILYPYYKKSLEEGMTKEEAKQILRSFWELLNSYSDAASLMNVGGREYNELSEFLIECHKEFSMPSPILGARICEDTPEKIWNMLIDEKFFRMGQPTFYGEDACIRALREKGVDEESAERFSNNSCMGISIAGEEFNSMWGCVISVCAALEMALNHGKLLTRPTDFTVPGMGDYDSFEELFDAFGRSFEYLLGVMIRSYRTKIEICERTDPDSFVSLLTGDCIEKHCDRISGAKYHNVTVECFGMINAADGLYAIDRLVFKEKKYTVRDFNEAVKNNFVGSEQLRADIMSCSKYGMNSEADAYAVRVAELLQKIIRSKNYENRIFSPSLHTLDVNVAYGTNWGASYDGRLAGAPYAKNGGPSNEARQSDPTSMILSAAKLPQYKFFGGQPIDVNFSPDMVNNHKKEIAALIQVYLKEGGIQFQVNCLSSKLLREAAADPSKYPGLVIRVGGYSVYFNNLSKESKEEFIQRIEKEGC